MKNKKGRKLDLNQFLPINLKAHIRITKVQYEGQEWLAILLKKSESEPTKTSS